MEQEPPPAHPPAHRPEFSLAGRLGPSQQQTSYVDPKYYDLNPKYQRQPQGPLWGLAKPLPRVVRRGMLGKQDVIEDKQAEQEQPGSSEAIPQVGMIEEQRDQSRKGTNEHVARKGYGNQRGGPKSHPSGAGESAVERFGTPGDEKANPMEDWLAGQPSAKSQETDPFPEYDQRGDLGSGQHRKSDFPQHPGSVTAAEDFAQQDDQSIDLEAGDKVDDWAVNDKEAEQYLREHRDEYNNWSSIRARLREPLAECLAVSTSPSHVGYMLTISRQ